MISANNVTLRVGKKALFEDVNIKFTEGNCYGVSVKRALAHPPRRALTKVLIILLKNTGFCKAFHEKSPFFKEKSCENRVGGWLLNSQPTSHRTVRTGPVHGSSPVYAATDLR